LSVPIDTGSLVGGRYRIDGVIGHGEHTVVFSAIDERGGAAVAVKTLLPGELEHESSVARFQREVEAAAQLRNRHIAVIHELGTLESGAPYIVMERLRGETLSARVKRVGPLPAGIVLGLADQICEALSAAHSKGVIHRDVTPKNVFLAAEGDGELVKVIDFGLSKKPANSGKELTLDNEVVGSPHHISPEQVRARPVDARTDVWAVGTCLYEALSGKRAFDAKTLPRLIVQVTTEEPPPLAPLGVPAPVERVIRRCLRKNPDERYPSIDALRAALRALSGGTPEPEAPLTSATHAPPAATSKTWVWALLVLVAIAAAVFALRAR
jgi:serine/threonine-protein kinase